MNINVHCSVNDKSEVNQIYRNDIWIEAHLSAVKTFLKSNLLLVEKKIWFSENLHSKWLILVDTFIFIKRKCMQLSTKRFVWKYNCFSSILIKCALPLDSNVLNSAKIEILKMSVMEYFYLINFSKWYHVYKNPTIHLLDMKYGNYTLNTLTRMKLNILDMILIIEIDHF
jgi:hypothetical protein